MNILNNEHFKKIKQQNPTINLQPTKTKVFAYGANYPLYLLGQFTAEIEHNSKRVAGLFGYKTKQHLFIELQHLHRSWTTQYQRQHNFSRSPKSKNHSNPTTASQSIPRDGKS